MDKGIKNNLVEAWENCHQSSLDYLRDVPKEKLKTKPFYPRFKSFAWEFSCILFTRYAYLRAFKTGGISFEPGQGVPSFSKIMGYDKEKFVQEMHRTGKEFMEKARNLSGQRDHDCIFWLIQHERIHQGKLMLYFAKAKVKIPKSFKNTWGGEKIFGDN